MIYLTLWVVFLHIVTFSILAAMSWLLNVLGKERPDSFNGLTGENTGLQQVYEYLNTWGGYLFEKPAREILGLWSEINDFIHLATIIIYLISYIVI